MADTTKAAGNTAVPQGDRDRVAMLSLRRDGTPDQVNPEIIGDKKFALEAAKRQFAEQAVSAVDAQERSVSPAGGEPVEQDPTIAALKEKHDAAQEAAESAAESTVTALFAGDEPAAESAPAKSTSRKAAQA